MRFAMGQRFHGRDLFPKGPENESRMTEPFRHLIPIPFAGRVGTAFLPERDASRYMLALDIPNARYVGAIRL
jgi:hypothetical protein